MTKPILGLLLICFFLILYYGFRKIDRKLEEAHPTQKDSPEYRKLVGEIEERYQDSR